MIDTTSGRRGLGRGLSALLGDAEPSPALNGEPSASQETPIELLRRNPDQPRKTFDEAELEELTLSIRERGVLQPILVRPAAGAPRRVSDRRRRAALAGCSAAGLHTVPVLVRTLDDGEVAEISIIENVQRADLNPLKRPWATRHCSIVSTGRRRPSPKRSARAVAMSPTL